jgi:hypothetical protein
MYRFKLTHRQHSGRLRPHEHTSYVSLLFILLVVGLALTASTVYAWDRPLPQESSISLTGTMPANPPTVAAQIAVPADQKHFDLSPITVSGTCPKDTLVELFKNDIFAGSTACTESGTFKIDIDLMMDKNVLIAKVYDALNQAGPDSNTVTIYYDLLPTQASSISPFGADSNQLLLNTDAAFRGSFPQQELYVPIDIIGGAPPYAINVQWGDSNNKVVSRNDNTTFKVSHIYQKPGTYQISIQATDTAGRVAFLSVASIVNGPASIISATSAASQSLGEKLLVLWPLYAAAVAVVISFFIGEKREKRVLKHEGLLITN